MYKRILAPLDGSELAEVALPYAEGLAAGLGSELTLIHICSSEKAEDYHTHEVYIQNMAETIRQRGEAEGIKVNSAHLVGHTAEQIVDYADREDIGLIVMATHGYSGIRRWVLGNVASKVVRATNRPVALIRADQRKVRR
jgi:nucleotide-binding universal stress UspA family protein